MLVDLPKRCDIGSKVNAKGYLVSWKGYKLHIDTADGQIPISCILTSASVHDSYKERSTAERINARLKDEFGGLYIRVRGHSKIMAHLMFGILALTVD